MPGQVLITVTKVWDQEEPDGSACVVCGEQCFLSMWRLYFSAPKVVMWASEAVLCDACYNAVTEGE